MGYQLDSLKSFLKLDNEDLASFSCLETDILSLLKNFPVLSMDSVAPKIHEKLGMGKEEFEKSVDVFLSVSQNQFRSFAYMPNRHITIEDPKSVFFVKRDFYRRFSLYISNMKEELYLGASTIEYENDVLADGKFHIGFEPMSLEKYATPGVREDIIKESDNLRRLASEIPLAANYIISHLAYLYHPSCKIFDELKLDDFHMKEAEKFKKAFVQSLNEKNLL